MPSSLKYLLLLVLLLAGQATATVQQVDLLHVDGKVLPMTTTPLAPHLAKIGWKPPVEAIIVSSNWRGYVAEWAIEDGRLVLVGATIMADQPEVGIGPQSIKDALFPGQARVVADWYTGALVVPDGQEVENAFLGHAPRFDRYQVFRVASGELLERLALTGEQFDAYRMDRFKAYMKTPEFLEQCERLRERGWDDQEILRFLWDAAMEYYLALPARAGAAQAG